MNAIEVKIPVKKGVFLFGKIIQKEGLTGKRPVILVIHGWSSNLERYIDRVQPFVEKGFIALLFDMRGHGLTGGNLKEFSANDHLDDCVAAFDFIKKIKNADLENITVFGSSYGGYQACLLVGKRRVQTLILKAPALYDDELFEIPDKQNSPETKAYRLQSHSTKDNTALNSLNKFNGRILFIECEKDEMVSKQNTNDYRDSIADEYDYELLKGADHALKLPGANQALIDALATWVSEI